MKNKLIFAFTYFLIVEYILRTFVEQYKYHVAGNFMEILPLIIGSLIISFLSRKTIETQNFRKVCLKLSLASIAGFLTAKTILFFQWYWIIAPEYRNVNGDMEEGLAWTLMDSLFGALEIVILFLIFVIIIKASQKGKSQTTTANSSL